MSALSQTDKMAIETMLKSISDIINGRSAVDRIEHHRETEEIYENDDGFLQFLPSKRKNVTFFMVDNCDQRG